MNDVFFRDFDLEIEEEALARKRAAERRYNAADLAAAVEAARAEGWADGHAAGKFEGIAEQEQATGARHAEALEALKPELAELLSRIGAHHQALETQLLIFALSVGERVLPDIIAHTAPERVLEQARAGVQMAHGQPKVQIRVSPDMLDQHGQEIRDIAALSESAMHLDLAADPDLANGAVRLRWNNGFMDYSFDGICDAILGLLRDDISARPPISTDEAE